MKFIETSAKTSENVGNSFTKMTGDIIKNIKDRTPTENKEPRIDISNNRAKNISLKKSECCN